MVRLLLRPGTNLIPITAISRSLTNMTIINWVTEVVTEFPPVLDQENYAEAVIEILSNDGDPLGPGQYYIEAEFDARDLGLRLPPSHRGIFTALVGYFEVREVRTAADRANYHYLKAQQYIKEGNVAAAAELIAGTVADSDSTWPWLRLGEFYEQQMKAYDRAIRAYERVRALSERKGLRPPDGNRPRMKRVDRKVLYEEPPYWLGMIERVREKQ